MIKLMKSTFYNEVDTKRKLCDFIMSASQLSMGDECKKYEIAFAKRQERKHALFVANGSAANLVLLQSLLNLGRLKKGDKVGFSALTWATNTMPIIQLGLDPVALDCELNTLNVSPATLEKQIKDLKALFITNVLGFSDNLEEISSLCSKNGIILLEDNCESLGSRAYGKLLGNFGLASTFSNYVGHHVSTIEGGFICTDDDTLNDMIVMVRAHGWDRNLNPESQKKLRSQYKVSDFYAKYTFYDLAFNCRPTEINGFIGNIQLTYLDEMIAKRVNNFNRFNQAISNNPDFITLKLGHMDLVSNMSMTVLCKTKQSFDKYIRKFQDAQVEIRPIIAGDITKQPFYRKYKFDIKECPNAAFVHDNGFYFPNNPELTEEEVSLLVSLLNFN